MSVADFPLLPNIEIPKRYCVLFKKCWFSAARLLADRLLAVSGSDAEQHADVIERKMEKVSAAQILMICIKITAFRGFH